MNYCTVGINAGIEKAIDGKNYLSYDENVRTIRILPTRSGKINEYNTYSVASSLAKSLNKVVLSGLPLKINPIFRVARVGAYYGVEWAITPTQANLLNDAYDDKYKALYEQDAKEKEEEYFQKRLQEELERGVDYNISDDDLLFIPEEFTGDQATTSKIKSNYFPTGPAVKVSEMLKRIAAGDYSLAPLAKKLLEYSEINDIGIILKDQPYLMSKNGLKGAGTYNNTTNRIEIAEHSMLAKANPERLIIHEILHALSYHALRRGGELNKAFREIYSKSIEKLGKYDPISKEGYYGNYTIDEFFVALFTDAEFIKKLQETEPINSKEFKNLFQEIIDLIFGLLKMQKNSSLYTQAFSIASNILNDEKLYTDLMLESAGYSQSEYNNVAGDVLGLIEKGNDFTLSNNIDELNLSEEQIDTIYKNYVNLMDRKREGKAVSKEIFYNQVLAAGQVFNHKGTYIFGEWDKENKLFKGRIMSATNIRTLYESLDVLFANISFMASVPEDMGKMLDKKGLYKLDVDKPYNFKGEEMIKNLYFTNKDLVEKVFKKSAESVTYEDVAKYDSFYNRARIFKKMQQLSKAGKYMELFPYLKEMGIYDYNAYRIVRAAFNKQPTIKEFQAVIQEIRKRSLDKLVNINKNDLLNNPVLYSQIDNEVNSTLATYLSHFGIKTELLTDIQTKLNIDSLATVDILNKIIYSDINDQSQYAEKAGRLIAYMMQHNPLVTDIFAAMRSLKRFKGISKDEMLDAVGDMIANELYNRKQLPVPQTLLDKIKTLISDFFNLISRVRLKRINRNIGIIADGIMLQNKALVSASIYKPGAEFQPVQRISLMEALKSDAFGNDVIDRMSEYFILTGSITLAEQGTIYRPSENQIHDLDWVSPFGRKKTIEIFYKLYPDAIYIRNIHEVGAVDATDTWLIAPEGYSIQNLKLEGAVNKVMGYDIVDSEGNVVSQFIPKNEYTGQPEAHTGPVEAKLIDIFTYEKESEREKDMGSKSFTLPSGKELRISDWQVTFAAKLRYGRIKDIWDYNRFVPNENIYLEEHGPAKTEPTKVLELSPKSPKAVYSAIFVDTDSVVASYGQTHPNLYSHHSTIEFKPETVTSLPIGLPTTLKIIGRLTTDKVDVLLVDNPLSKNKYPHITLSTAEGVKPFESNKAIEENLDKIVPLNQTIGGVIGYHDGNNEIVSSEELLVIEESPIKEGVAEVFEQNPELVLIGTAQEYSDYLDTTTNPTIEDFKEHMDFKNNVKDYFNLNQEEAKFVKDQSNLNINC